MSLGLIGRKVGMMRIFNDDGSSVPVTVLDCAGNRIAQIKRASVGDSADAQITREEAERVAERVGGLTIVIIRQKRIAGSRLGAIRLGIGRTIPL